MTRPSGWSLNHFFPTRMRICSHPEKLFPDASYSFSYLKTACFLFCNLVPLDHFLILHMFISSWYLVFRRILFHLVWKNLQAHPCCHRWHHFHSFNGKVTFHYIYVPHSVDVAEDRLGVWDWHMHVMLYLRWMFNKDFLYSTGNTVQYSGNNMYMNNWITLPEPETRTTLLINYALI